MTLKKFQKTEVRDALYSTAIMVVICIKTEIQTKVLNSITRKAEKQK